MRFISLFSKHMNSIYRCISSACLLLQLAYSIFFYSFAEKIFYIPFTALLILSSAILIIILIFPQRIELLSVPAFFYSAYFLFAQRLTLNSLSLLFYIAACSILFSRGYFRKYRWTKVIIASAVYFFIFVSSFFIFNADKLNELSSTAAETQAASINSASTLSTLSSLSSLYFLNLSAPLSFIREIILLAAESLLLFLIIFFYYLYLRNQGKSPIEKVLDLNQFTELTSRDKEWLALILKETKYSTIASQYNVSLGTVKNRMRYIFNIIDVSDRIGFMATYGGYTLNV